jgi:acyl-CoA hydrolase
MDCSAVGPFRGSGSVADAASGGAEDRILMAHDPKQGRRISDSAVEMTELVLPHHANVHGSVLGGTVMHWIDLAAAVVANRHSRRPVVTAAIDEMSFLAPIEVGELALIRARITFVDRSSMEIRVDVESENLLSGERRHTSTAFVTFVAIDPVTRRPSAVPPLVLETDEERAEFERARVRRQHRLELRREHRTAARGSAS